MKNLQRGGSYLFKVFNNICDWRIYKSKNIISDGNLDMLKFLCNFRISNNLLIDVFYTSKDESSSDQP